MVKNIYKICVRAIKFFTLAVSIYGLWVSIDNLNPLSLILTILSLVGWLLQVLLDIVLYIINRYATLVKEAIMADIDELKKPVTTVSNFFKKMTGKEVEEKEISKTRAKLDEMVNERKAELKNLKAEAKEQKKQEKLEERERKRQERQENRFSADEDEVAKDLSGHPWSPLCSRQTHPHRQLPPHLPQHLHPLLPLQALPSKTVLKSSPLSALPPQKKWAPISPHSASSPSRKFPDPPQNKNHSKKRGIPK